MYKEDLALNNLFLSTVLGLFLLLATAKSVFL